VSHTPVFVVTLDRSLWPKCCDRRIDYYNRDSLFSVQHELMLKKHLNIKH